MFYLQAPLRVLAVSQKDNINGKAPRTLQSHLTAHNSHIRQSQAHAFLGLLTPPNNERPMPRVESPTGPGMYQYIDIPLYEKKS